MLIALPPSVRTWCVLVQPEMEKRRSPLVSIPPFGRGFSRHGVFRSDGGWAAQERALTPRFIVSMSPPGYPADSWEVDQGSLGNAISIPADSDHVIGAQRRWREDCGGTDRDGQADSGRGVR